jgi:thiol-disulfide isomerase/thioredoxin
MVVLALLVLVLGLHFASGSAGTSGGSGKPGSGSGTVPAVGYPAPNGAFTTLAGQKETVAQQRGKATLLWFVSTWCSSCQAGTQTMARNLPTLSSDGIRVVEVELYNDLGQSGPSMGQFAKSLAGSNFSNPDWTFGISSQALTRTYDPGSYLDIYYLLNARGQVYYVNSTPSSTMPQILRVARHLA